MDCANEDYTNNPYSRLLRPRFGSNSNTMVQKTAVFNYKESLQILNTILVYFSDMERNDLEFGVKMPILEKN